jgi:hypothetical protein
MTAYAGNTTTSTPTMATATSVTVATANPFRKCLIIQNTYAANIAIGREGQALTGIAATSPNKCYVLPSRAGSNVLRFTEGFIPAGAITAYQTSGSPINTLVVIEG